MDNKKILEELPSFTRFTCRKAGEKNRSRAMKEEDGRIFVFSKGKRKFGWRYRPEEFLLFYTDFRIPDQDEKAWKKRIAKASRKLETSGLWPEIKTYLDNLLKISLSDWKDMRSIYWGTPYNQNRAQALASYHEKYPFMFSQDEDGELYISSDYFSDLAICKTKAMYFGKYENRMIKEQIKEAMEEKRTFTSGRIQANYDVSFEYRPEKQMAWYSEEYRNCGNGHYYIALDANTALHLEDD